ncbi:MAG: phage tail tape measure protein, partial [Victivallales bacterium]
MVSTGSILAGAAYVKLMLEDSDTRKGLERVRKNFQMFSAGMVAAGTKLQFALNAPFAAMRQAVSVFSLFDDKMRMVKAVTGASGAAFDMLTEKAKKLGRETAFTAQQVAEGMISLGRMGFKPKEIDNAIGSIMALSSATGTELSEAAQIAANNMRVFKIETDKTSEVADILTVTANGSAQTLVDLGESLKMAGPHVKNAGENIEDACAALGILANMGIRGSLAGTALGKSYKQLVDPKVREFLRSYGIETTDATGNLRKMRDILLEVGKAMAKMPSADRITFAEKVFDARGSLGGGILAGNMGGFDEFLKKLENSAGVAKKTMNEMESGIGGMRRELESALEGVSVAFGEVLSGPLISLGKSFTQCLLSIRLWIKENDALVRNVTMLTGGLFALGGAMKIAGMAAGVFSALLSPLTKLPAALAAVTGMMNAANISMVTAASTSQYLCTVNTATLVSAMRLAAGGKGLTAVLYAKAIAAKVAAGAMGLLAGAMNFILAHPIAISFAVAAGTIFLLKNRADALTASLQKAYNLFQKISNESDSKLQAGDENRMKNKIAAERLKELEELSKKAKLTAEQVKEAQELLNRLEFGTGKGSYGRVENGRVALNGDIETRVTENNRAEAERQIREQLRNKTLELNAAKAAENNILNGKR